MPIEKKCLTCGKIFFARPCRANKAKYCCHPCYAKSIIGTSSGRKTGRYIKCKFCNKEFWVQPNEEKQGRKFCSSKCYHNSPSPNIGRKFSEEAKLRLNWKKVRISPRVKKECKFCKKKFKLAFPKESKMFCSRKCSDLYHVGENAHNWKGGLTKLRDLLKRLTEHKDWRTFIFERDNYTCQICGKEDSGHLHAHHIKMISKIFEKYNIKTVEEAIKCKLLWDTNNGICLCENCHGRIRWHEEEYEELFRNIILKKQLQQQIIILITYHGNRRQKIN